MWNSSSLDFVLNMFKVIGIEGMIWDLEVEKDLLFLTQFLTCNTKQTIAHLKKMFLICVCTNRHEQQFVILKIWTWNMYHMLSFNLLLPICINNFQKNYKLYIIKFFG
jgi:hypothetical protein